MGGMSSCTLGGANKSLICKLGSCNHPTCPSISKLVIFIALIQICSLVECKSALLERNTLYTDSGPWVPLPDFKAKIQPQVDTMTTSESSASSVRQPMSTNGQKSSAISKNNDKSNLQSPVNIEPKAVQSAALTKPTNPSCNGVDACPQQASDKHDGAPQVTNASHNLPNDFMIPSASRPMRRQQAEMSPTRYNPNEDQDNDSGGDDDDSNVGPILRAQSDYGAGAQDYSPRDAGDADPYLGSPSPGPNPRQSLSRQNSGRDYSGLDKQESNSGPSETDGAGAAEDQGPHYDEAADRRQQEAAEASEAEQANNEALSEAQQAQREIIMQQAQSEARAIKQQQEALMMQQRLQQQMLTRRQNELMRDVSKPEERRLNSKEVNPNRFANPKYRQPYDVESQIKARKYEESEGGDRDGQYGGNSREHDSEPRQRYTGSMPPARANYLNMAATKDRRMTNQDIQFSDQAGYNRPNGAGGDNSRKSNYAFNEASLRRNSNGNNRDDYSSYRQTDDSLTNLVAAISPQLEARLIHVADRADLASAAAHILADKWQHGEILGDDNRDEFGY